MRYEDHGDKVKITIEYEFPKLADPNSDTIQGWFIEQCIRRTTGELRQFFHEYVRCQK